MPWCNDCDVYLSPSTVTPAGECPTCGHLVTVGEVAQAAEEELAPVPWHLKLLGLAVALYLIYRFAQIFGLA